MSITRFLGSLAVVISVSASMSGQAFPYIEADYMTEEFTAPHDAPSSIVVAGEKEPGARLVVTGRTLFGDTPVAGVSLYVFHTDVKGAYATGQDNEIGELHPRLHGVLRTDSRGRYRYETIRPGSYDSNPSHVHYVVKADGYEPLLLVLQFQDDRIIKRQAGIPPQDGGWAFRNGPCKARADCILTQPVSVDAQGVAHVVRDIQMVKK